MTNVQEIIRQLEHTDHVIIKEGHQFVNPDHIKFTYEAAYRSAVKDCAERFCIGSVSHKLLTEMLEALDESD